MQKTEQNMNDSWSKEFDKQFADFNFHHRKLPCFHDSVNQHAVKSFISSLLSKAKTEGNQFYYNRGYLDARQALLSDLQKEVEGMKTNIRIGIDGYSKEDARHNSTLDQVIKILTPQE